MADLNDIYDGDGLAERLADIGRPADAGSPQPERADPAQPAAEAETPELPEPVEVPEVDVQPPEIKLPEPSERASEPVPYPEVEPITDVAEVGGIVLRAITPVIDALNRTMDQVAALEATVAPPIIEAVQAALSEQTGVLDVLARSAATTAEAVNKLIEAQAAIQDATGPAGGAEPEVMLDLDEAVREDEAFVSESTSDFGIGDTFDAIDRELDGTRPGHVTGEGIDVHHTPGGISLVVRDEDEPPTLLPDLPLRFAVVTGLYNDDDSEWTDYATDGFISHVGANPYNTSANTTNTDVTLILKATQDPTSAGVGFEDIAVDDIIAYLPCDGKEAVAGDATVFYDGVVVLHGAQDGAMLSINAPGDDPADLRAAAVGSLTARLTTWDRNNTAKEGMLIRRSRWSYDSTNHEIYLLNWEELYDSAGCLLTVSKETKTKFSDVDPC